MTEVATASEKKPEPFEFDDAFQDKIAALAIKDENFARRTAGLIDHRHFENEASAALYRTAAGYQERYRALPSSITVWGELFKDELKNKRIKKEFYPEVIDKFKELYKAPIHDREFVIDKVADFAKHQAVMRAMVDGFALMEGGQREEAVKLMESAIKVGASKDIEMMDFWEETERRHQHRDDIATKKILKDGITTGLSKLDSLLFHQGWGRKELSVIMGGAKRGKSMALGEFGVRASVKGFNVLYITLEVDNSIIADRMDSNVSGISMSDLEMMRADIMDSVNKKAAGKRGKLLIINAPANTFKPSDMRRQIEYFKSQGITFDLICCDYLDIMAPERWTQDKIENSRTVWTDVREIAKEENLAILTATQTNRDGFKSSTAKAEDVSDDFNKVRIADVLISINRSEDEKARGEARLYFAASRNQKGEYTVKIRQDLERMKFIKSIEDIIEGSI